MSFALGVNELTWVRQPSPESMGMSHSKFCSRLKFRKIATSQLQQSVLQTNPISHSSDIPKCDLSSGPAETQ